MANSTVLVTGGAGYIGSHVVLQLRERGENVIVLDSLVTGFRQAVLDTPLVVGDGVHATNLDAGFYGVKVGARARHRFGAITLQTAPQIAAGKAQEHGGAARVRTLALQRVEAFLHRVAHGTWPGSAGPSSPQCRIAPASGVA